MSEPAEKILSFSHQAAQVAVGKVGELARVPIDPTGGEF